MKRIAYVIPSLSVGGTEWQLIHLLRGLSKDYRLLVICTLHDGALAGDARRLGARVRVIGSRCGGWDPRLRKKIAHILGGHRPDVLHSFLFGFDLWANQAARDAGVPVVISSRRQLATWRKRRHLWIQRKANGLVDAIVANSQAVAEYTIRQEGINPDLVRVIHNGVDADDFVSAVDTDQIRARYGIPAKSHVITSMANFSEVKDYPLFVDTAEALLRMRSDVHFLMVGNGPLVSAIEHRLREKRLAPRFTRISTVSERADIYALARVSVLCSKMEGFPNVVIEAMAAGTPVVAAAVGGVKELVQDGVSGRLVDSRKPEDFARTIAAVLEDPEGSQAMAERAAQQVRRELPMAKMIDGHRALYDELLARAGAGGG